ncbi:MAG: hypothetical protein AB8U25_06295 [Rickettsiales endosymbiont of Dermacentor nuttalli]
MINETAVGVLSSDFVVGCSGSAYQEEITSNFAMEFGLITIFLILAAL